MFLLCGCNKSIEIEDIGFVIGAGFDRTENGEVQIWVQMAMPSPSRDEIINLKGWIATSTGRNVLEAVKNVSKKISKELFWGHASILIIGEKMARNGLNELLEYITRSAEIRYTSLMAVTSDNIEEILLLESLNQSSTTVDLTGLFYTAQRVSMIPKSTFYDFISNSEERGKEVLLGRILLIDNKNLNLLSLSKPSDNFSSGAGMNKELIVEGSAVFLKDKMIGWLDGEQTSMALMLRNKMQKYEGILQLKDGFLGYVITEANSSINIENFDVNNLQNIKAEIDIVGNVDISMIWADNMLASIDDMDMLNDKLSQQIKYKLDNLMMVAQKEFKNDFTSIGEKVRQKSPMLLWENNLKEQWNNFFENIEVDISVNLRVKRRGLTFKQVGK